MNLKMYVDKYGAYLSQYVHAHSAYKRSRDWFPIQRTRPRARPRRPRGSPKHGLEMKQDIRRLVRDLSAQGFTIRTTSKGHLAVKRDGVTVAVLGGTPSDWRATHNFRAQLRRAGFLSFS